MFARGLVFAALVLLFGLCIAEAGNYWFSPQKPKVQTVEMITIMPGHRPSHRAPRGLLIRYLEKGRWHSDSI
jgi:hypothetical protein